MGTDESETGDKSSPPARRADLGGRRKGESLGLLFLRDSCGLGGLDGLGLGHALLELVDATGGIDELLLAGIERVADIANSKENGGPGGPGLDHVAAGATNLRCLVLRMDVRFHTKGEGSYQREAF